METSTINENQSKVNLIKFVEEKYLKNEPYSTKGDQALQIGDIVKIGYTIQEGNKERITKRKVNNCIINAITI